MELIAEIHGEKINSENKYTLRKAARAVIFDDKKRIALPFVSKNGYHKLPGGGIEKGEGIADALKREAMEEVGTDVEILSEIGMIIEYRDTLLQISYCFLARTIGGAKTPSFTDEEKENGFMLDWMDFDEAVRTMRREEPANYAGRFIRERDLAFLSKTKELLFDPRISITRAEE